MPIVDIAPVANSIDRSVDRACDSFDRGYSSLLRTGSNIAYAVAVGAGLGYMYAMRRGTEQAAIHKLLFTSAFAAPMGVALRCSEPEPPITAQMRSAALIAKPKKDSVSYAKELLRQNAPMPPQLADKLQLRGVEQKSLAFEMHPEKKFATAAFKDELNACGLPAEVVKSLSATDFSKAGTNCKTSENFKIDGGKGLYYWISLRSSESTRLDDGKTVVSIALMMTVSSFEISNMLDRIETVTTEHPVYETVFEQRLKSKAGLIFGQREYETVAKDVVVGYKTETVNKPVFRDHAFTPGEIKVMNDHMKYQAAMEATNTFFIDNVE